jgi:hypothetical protein
VSNPADPHFPGFHLGPTGLGTQARQALIQNDRGGYTVSSPGLYPFQGNWDAAIVALGWMTFDEPRAWQEFDRLFAGQWSNGLVPHIVFHGPADTYFPGPGEWRVERTPRTSSLSQPPLAASIIRLMMDRAADPAAADRAVCRLLPKLLAWHRWWYRDRDPERTGLVVTFHPWESGMGNSPAWDPPLTSVPGTTRAYERKDLAWIDAARRPRQFDYDRFVYLMDFQRERSFDAERIYAETPYRVADFGLNAILLRATEDLAELCRRQGEFSSAAEMDRATERARTALASLWSEPHSCYVSRDTRNGESLRARTGSTFLAWYGRISRSPFMDRKLLANLHEWLSRSSFGLATAHPDSPEFEPERCWRGSVWPHLNWLIAQGLAESGHRRTATRLRDDTRTLIATGGLRECFNPLTGAGCGGEAFSRTAAVSLFWTESGRSA